MFFCEVKEMGYWAKDGAYVHEDSDYDTINIREEERKEDERKSARRHAELIEKQNEKIKEEQEYRHKKKMRPLDLVQQLLLHVNLEVVEEKSQ